MTERVCKQCCLHWPAQSYPTFKHLFYGAILAISGNYRSKSYRKTKKHRFDQNLLDLGPWSKGAIRPWKTSWMISKKISAFSLLAAGATKWSIVFRYNPTCLLKFFWMSTFHCCQIKSEEKWKLWLPLNDQLLSLLQLKQKNSST